MGCIECISRLRTLFGFGSLPRFFFCARVVKTKLFFLLFFVLFSASSNAADMIAYDSQGNIYPNAAAACAANGARAAAAGYSYNGGYTMVPGSNRFECPGKNPWGTDVESIGGGSIQAGTCPATTIENSDGSGCYPANQKCQDAKGAVQKSHTWQQTTDTPTAPPVGGCGTTIGGVAICRANAALGGFTCTADVTITGDLYVPPPPTTTPGTGDGDTGGDTGGGNTGDPGGDTGGDTGGGDTGGGNNGGGSGGGGSGGSGGGSGGSGGTGGGSGDSGDGSGSGDSGGGTGGGGSGDGSGGGGSGDGNGSGDGECTGEDCGEEGEDKVSGDMQCDTVVSCDGDVIQCAVLRQEQQSRCADKDWRDLSEKKIADLKTSLDNEFAGQDYQPIKATPESTFDISKMIDTSSRFGASCPALPVISVPFVNGTSFRFDPNFDGLCMFLTYMGYLMVAFAMRKAAEIIATGV